MPYCILLLLLAMFAFVAPVAWTVAVFTVGRAAGHFECRTAPNNGFGSAAIED